MDVPKRSLSREDLDRWAHILNASAAQRHSIGLAYEQYVEQHNEFMDREAPPYLSRGNKLNELGLYDTSTPAFAALQREVGDASLRLRRHVTSIEHLLIDSIEEILTKDQRERLDILRKESQRRNCRTYTSFVRFADVELRDVWEQSASAVASPEQIQRVDRILENYESQLTVFVCRNSEFQVERRQRLAANRVARNQGRISLDEAKSRYLRIMQDGVAVARTVRILNAQTVEAIRHALDGDAALIFVDAAKQAAFPDLYPDRSAIHIILQSAVSDKELGPEIDLVRGLRNAYEIEYGKVSLEIERFCVEWGDCAEEGVVECSPQFLPDALRPHLQRRTALSEQFLAQLKDLVGDEALQRHLKSAQARRSTEDSRGRE